MRPELVPTRRRVDSAFWYADRRPSTWHRVCAAMVGMRDPATTDFLTAMRLGPDFPDAGRDRFGSPGDSTTNVSTRTGPQGRFFIDRNPVSSRDFARFCRCHARRVLRPKPARFASLFLSLLNLPSPTGANWHRQNSCRGTKLRSCRRERSESMIGAAIGVREPRGGDHPAAHGMRYKPSFWLVTTSAS